MSYCLTTCLTTAAVLLWALPVAGQENAYVGSGVCGGIWALYVLRRREIQAYFGVSIRQRNQVIPPAIGLMLAAITGGLFWIVMGVSLPLASYRPHQHGPEPIIGFFMILGGSVVAFMQIRGAVHMMRLRSYQASVFRVGPITRNWRGECGSLTTCFFT